MVCRVDHTYIRRLTLSMKIVLVLPPLLATDDPNLATILRDLIAAVDRCRTLLYFSYTKYSKYSSILGVIYTYVECQS